MPVLFTGTVDILTSDSISIFTLCLFPLSTHLVHSHPRLAPVVLTLIYSNIPVPTLAGHAWFTP
ncbi:hypothetical protein C2E23DRAFT_822917 [Lenzites betulinus]|nr:hypothetical protein C2E23DRAFT_822917 [Lenzites betulinus]